MATTIRATVVRDGHEYVATWEGDAEPACTCDGVAIEWVRLPEATVRRLEGGGWSDGHRLSVASELLELADRARQQLMGTRPSQRPAVLDVR